MPWNVFKKSPEEIRDIQLKKIKRIVKAAYENSSFYRNYYQAGDFYPDDLKSFEDIKKIPVVKRISLKNTPVEQILTRRDFNNLHLHTTSGSSGTPVKFYYTGKENLIKNIGVLRAYFMMGMKPTDITVALRDPVDIRKKPLYERFGLLRYDYQNIYDGMDVIYERLRQKYESIDILKGMPSDLTNLAYQVRKNGKRFPKVSKIFSDSEVLDDFSRKYVSETFGAPVLDFYGSVENGCIAFQMTGSDKYYINETQVLLEGLNGGTSQDDAIITNLRNTTFPIIRYQIGDVIDFGDGKSDLKGITVRTIDRIYGKYLDFIILPDKTIVSPHVPKQEMTHGIAGVRKFQIIQTDFDRVTVKIERDDDYAPETEKLIIDRLTKAFKGQIACAVEYDDALSTKTKNKFKCISSAVAQTFLSDKA